MKSLWVLMLFPKVCNLALNRQGVQLQGLSQLIELIVQAHLFLRLLDTTQISELLQEEIE